MKDQRPGGRIRLMVAIAFVVLALLWGTTPLAIKSGLLADWDPLWFCALRLLTASLLISPLLLTRYAGEPLGLSGWRKIWPIGVFGMAVNFGITVWGQQFIGAALASLIVGTQPITTTMIDHLVRRDRPTTRFVFSLVAGAAGMSLVFRGAGVPDAAALVGALAVFAGVTVYGGVFVYINTHVGTLNPFRVVAGQNLIGGVLVALAAGLFEGTPQLPTGAQAWGTFGYLALVSSIVALLLANWLIGRMGAARFSVLSFITPIIGMIASVVVLGDSLDAITIVGAGLVGVALVLALTGRARARARQKEPDEPGLEELVSTS